MRHFDPEEVGVLDVLQYESRPQVFFIGSDLNVIKLNALYVPHVKPVRRHAVLVGRGALAPSSPTGRGGRGSRLTGRGSARRSGRRGASACPSASRSLGKPASIRSSIGMRAGARAKGPPPA